MRGASRQELISDGTTLPGRRSSRYSRTSVSSESSSSRSPVGALGQPDAWKLYVSCCGLSGTRDRRTDACQIFIARIELHFGYPLSRPACGLGALRLLAGLPTRITSRECLRIKIEQVEIVIRPLDDTPTTGSSKLDSDGRCAKRRSLLQSI